MGRDIKTKLETESSGTTEEFIDATVEEWRIKLPAICVDVLYIKEKEIATKASEAATKKYFKRQATLKATKDVEAALDKVDDSEMASKPLNKKIREHVYKATAKELRKMEAKEQSKQLGSAKTENQAPRPGNSGPSLNRNSKEKRNKSRNKSTKPSSKTSGLEKNHTPGKDKHKKGTKRVISKKKTKTQPTPKRHSS